MNVLAQFQTISDNDKAAVVRKLMQSSTPDFDFFYLVGLSILMATLGLLADSTATTLNIAGIEFQNGNPVELFETTLIHL